MARTTVAGGYLGRLALVAVGAVLGSGLGSTFTWWTDNWTHANPVLAGPWAACFSLGPAMLIAATAATSRVVTAVVAAICFVMMLGMWWQFATSDSSTAALVFALGWFAGIPAAIVLVAATWPRSARDEFPSQVW